MMLQPSPTQASDSRKVMQLALQLKAKDSLLKTLTVKLTDSVGVIQQLQRQSTHEDKSKQDYDAVLS
jgi:hypothetical protein